MDRLQLALRRYQQLVPKPAPRPWDVPLSQLEVWLDEDVNSVLDNYARRPLFRDFASWPLRVLKPDAVSRERELVNQIDAELLRCAKAAKKLTDSVTLRKKIAELFPAQRIVVSESVDIGSGGAQSRDQEYGDYDETSLELRQLACMATKDRPDLVNPNDYFEPVQEYSRDDSGKRVQHGDWIVSMNPGLLPVGNFVVRCLLKRIGTQVELLQSIIRKTRSALSAVRASYTKSREELEASWESLGRLVQELDERLRTGRDIRMVDAAVAATQIYAAFHVAPDVGWLGLPPEIVEHGSMLIKARTRQLKNAEMFDRIAVALGELQQLYEGQDEQQSILEQAVASGGLVIVTANSKAYWETKPLPELPPNSWHFLTALAKKARLQGFVDTRDVFGDKEVTESAISSAWARLKNALPASLSKLVFPGRAKATYQLKLDAHRIHFVPPARR